MRARQPGRLLRDPPRVGSHTLLHGVHRPAHDIPGTTRRLTLQGDNIVPSPPPPNQHYFTFLNKITVILGMCIWPKEVIFVA